MPATIVPCPKSSPVALGSRDDRLICVTTRVPKSAAREASTPESITAIAGVAGAGATSLPHSGGTSAVACQRLGSVGAKSLPITRPSSETRSTPAAAATVCKTAAGTFAATPSMIESCRRICPPAAVTAAVAACTLSAWTMT